MKFGLFYQLPCAEWQSPVQRYRDTLEQIQLGDELGFDNAWLAELHFDPRFSITPSPLMLATAAAQRTTHIRLGVAVNLLPLHNPVKMAEDIATLDILSGGRVEFGVGRGVFPHHFRGLGVPQEENRERFLESLEFIVKAWTHERFSFEGKFYQAADLRVVPKPFQKPHPPIRIAANSSATFEVVAKLGYPMLSSPVIIPMPLLREGIATYRRDLVAAGHPASAGELSVALPVFVAQESEKARSVPETSVTSYLDIVASTYGPQVTHVSGNSGSPATQAQTRLQEMTYERWLDEVAVYGDPDQCAGSLSSVVDEFDPWEIICWFNPGGLISHSDVADAMRLFASEVMPRFR